MTLRWTITFCLLLCVTACIKPPRQELDAAEYLVARAYIMEAPEFAATEYQAAQSAMQAAKADIKKGNYPAAEASLHFSRQHALRAITITEEIKARKAAEERARIQAEEQQQAAEQARIAEESRLEQQRAQARKPVPTPEPEPPQPVPSYDVKEGETLWTIANQPVVYGDGLLWPLLYQANRDQIKDPRQIFSGQTLTIRRDITDEEREEARQKARESDIFPVSNPEEPSP
jgi:nucleoid-associated protein YgaU